jgi:ectoine hydroxylase-related dioxygenase (phytanoyl-CoA dioxygenase family)
MATGFFRDEALHEQFNRNGYVILDLLSASEVAALRGEHERLMKSKDEGRSREHLYESSRTHNLDWNLEVSATIQRALSPAIDRVFQNYELFGGTFLLKVPKVSTLLPLHQDWTVVDEDRYQSLFVWCPLVDTGPANGGLFVLPGSHAYFQNYRSGSMPSRRILPEGKIKEHIVDVVLPAGHVIAYSDRLFHGSYGNTTDQPRIVATGRVNQREAELLYYHKVDADRVDVIKASPTFYLRDGEGLDRGELPAGAEAIRTLSYRYEPVTEQDLVAKLP